jgi:2-methylisocitrate lyase-like PEP mutase family enzyme
LGLRTVLLVVCGLLVVNFCVAAFWMQDQMYQRAARLNLLAALICLAALTAGLAGFEAAALTGAALALVLGISSFRLLRIGRG